MISRYHNEAKKIYGNYYTVIPCVKMYIIYVYNQSLIDLLLTRNSCLSLFLPLYLQVLPLFRCQKPCYLSPKLHQTVN